MREFKYRLVNVFAEAALEGNPLCVFEDGRGLDDATMQALALQFNLSETTFVLPSERATARVRIFTPTFEMPFAGHPTLGTAHVVRHLRTAGDGSDKVTLEMQVGVVPVTGDGDRWTLSARPPSTRHAGASREDLARFLRLDVADIGEQPLWVDTGAEQLVIPLASVAAVRRVDPDAGSMSAWPKNSIGRSMFYVWSALDAGQSEPAIEARFFFTKHVSVIEDPGTGSACANLGGWMIATGGALPAHYVVHQGSATGRPCRLGLSVDAGGAIAVSGRVIEIGSGIVRLP